jgi:hypothetical protein
MTIEDTVKSMDDNSVTIVAILAADTKALEKV